MHTERCSETTTLSVSLAGGAVTGDLEIKVNWEATPYRKTYIIDNISLEIGAQKGLRWRKAPDYLHDLLVTDDLRHWCLMKTLSDDYERRQAEPHDTEPEPQEQA